MKHYSDITKIHGYDLEPVDVNYKVYLYEFPDGKKYVGMTKLTLEERRDCGYQHNHILRNAIKTAGGWNGFKHTILKENLSKEEAEETEIFYIKEFNSTDDKFGYNISNGGSSTFKGLKHKDASKRKISDANMNKKFTHEHLMNLSKSHKGKGVGQNNGRSVKVHKFDMDWNYLETYETTTDAGRSNGIDRRGISDCIYGRQLSCGGYKWSTSREGAVLG